MASEVTQHTMPNGATCWYRDKDHGYFKSSNGDGTCSGKIPGVTTIAKNAGDTKQKSWERGGAAVRYSFQRAHAFG